MLLPEPKCFGLPEKFTSWRVHQDQAIWEQIHSEKRFHTCIAAVGSGKSLSYVTTALVSGKRAVILTSTKQLQTQLMRDFSDIGMVDVRGRNAYECRLESDGTTCDHGPCVTGANCQFKRGGCDYFDAMRAAKSASLIVTNYACWMTQLKHGHGFGEIDLLICDEAHDIPSMLDSFLTIDLNRRQQEIKDILPMGDLNHLTLEDWRGWAKAHINGIDEEITRLSRNLKDGGNRSARRRLSVLKALKGYLDTISQLSEDDEWVFETDEYSVRFAPAWPAQYAESALFHHIDKVILTSGSVRPKTLEILGINSEDSEVVEYPHTFPVDRRILFHVPTIRLNRHTTPEQLKVLTVRVDQVIRNRMDRKGLIHTVSYARNKFVYEHSEFAAFMMTNKRGKAEAALKKYLESVPPTILISPSMMTGVDLPYDHCRYQIILKVPYPSTQGALMKARSERDPGYPSYIAAQNLVQAYGRTTRSEDDLSETVIVDDNILWFLWKYKDYVPQYFHDAFRSVRSIPSPPQLE